MAQRRTRRSTPVSGSQRGSRKTSTTRYTSEKKAGRPYSTPSERYGIPPRTSSATGEPNAEGYRAQENEEALTSARDGDDSNLLFYSPTATTNPSRPRTLSAGYDPSTGTVRVRFRDGTPWSYYNVPVGVWKEFFAADSPGRFIRETLDSYSHGPGDF